MTHRPSSGSARRAGVRRATIRDVAAAAGVSVKTVSHAVNGKGEVDPGTRARVLAEAAKLGYRASRNARSLRSGRTSTIALLLPSLGAAEREMLGLSYYMLLASAAASTAFGLEHSLLLSPAADDGDNLRRLDADGVLLCDPVALDPRIDVLAGQGIPVVTIERDPGRPDHDWCVVGDNREATWTLLDHLAAAGAERIALLASDSEWGWTVESVDAYRAWCAQRGAEPIEARASLHDLVRSAREQAHALLDRPDRPDAIVALAERAAAGVVQAARALGLTIPGDLMVASGADSPETTFGDPAITALDLHPGERGSAAAELLIDRLAGRATATSRTIAANLLVRASSQRSEGGFASSTNRSTPRSAPSPLE
ncbi:LacI family DNA-binding transcriptional regulator [Conexibacter woesei]|uniref:Transcriptional regulator, LacI family n=1 Tax=Conexibacter woesei (strain DSM 14684 / CCUG 47730 / CIP 108061 / JCM 11494 / NBRC 100937 / ID131577) TaxID=469383 RepID=D3F8L2_CONWI|nr:LacI family DNA-binding transcriptional regulator [Conexibacter woesei]ADB50976.1 transcriptional regulator, LacI family [Conexibacter woesei DSM 14684]